MHICEAELRYKLRWDEHRDGPLLEVLDELERRGLIESACTSGSPNAATTQLPDGYQPPLRYGGGIPWQVRS